MTSPARTGRDESDDAADALFLFGARIRLVGKLALLATLFNIGGLVIALYEFPKRASYRPSSLSPDVLFPACLAFTVSAVMAVALAESLRKRGDALFEEISDEIQWGVGRPRDESSASEDAALPPRRLRVALRQFAIASDLPLIPGRAGPGLYSMINLLSMTVTILLLGLGYND